MQKLPLETQTLYAEMMEQLIALEAQRSIGHVPGCFATKQVKGVSYYSAIPVHHATNLFLPYIEII